MLLASYANFEMSKSQVCKGVSEVGRCEQTKAIFEEGLRIEVGKGINIRSWFNTWVGSTTLRLVFPMFLNVPTKKKEIG